jgi:hypothetical protein
MQLEVSRAAQTLWRDDNSCAQSAAMQELWGPMTFY